MTTHADHVLTALKAAGRPLSAYEVLEACSDHGITAPPQVYRALKKLTDRGLVHRVDSLKAYVACDHPGHGPVTAFQVCDDCGAVSEAANAVPDLPASSSAFEVTAATLELHGRCAACRD